MRNRNRLLYQNIEEALEELNAKDKGRYFLCTCPECQQQEAFIYKNNPGYIQCNRENQCGERMILHFEEKKNVQSFKTIQKEYPRLTESQAYALDWMTRFMKHMQYFDSPTLDNGYRGLSRDTTKSFVVDLINKSNVQKMFEMGKVLFSKNYFKNDWMCQRNLVFPIYGDDGYVERILLRSSIAPDITPKELQLIVNPSKDTRDFFIDTPKDAKTVVVSEAILDGLSFREIAPEIGVIALTGAAKTRKLCGYISDHRALFCDKKFILALDRDEAGFKATREIIDSLEKVGVDYQVYPFPSDMKDANEYLNQNKEEFQKRFHSVKRSLCEGKVRGPLYSQPFVQTQMER